MRKVFVLLGLDLDLVVAVHWQVQVVVIVLPFLPVGVYLLDEVDFGVFAIAVVGFVVFHQPPNLIFFSKALDVLVLRKLFFLPYPPSARQRLVLTAVFDSVLPLFDNVDLRRFFF